MRHRETGALSFAEAAYHILKKYGRPLSLSEITSLALSEGILSTTGKTPAATMGARLYVDIKKKDNSAFIKVNKSKFALREWAESSTVTQSHAENMVGKNAPLR